MQSWRLPPDATAGCFVFFVPCEIRSLSVIHIQLFGLVKVPKNRRSPSDIDS